MSAIDALMYLANNIRPSVAFCVNLLARYSSSPTRRHRNEVKHIFHYLIFCLKDVNHGLVGYDDAEYLFDPHKNWSQTFYLFRCCNTTIS
jgi:hypothetical protein